MLKVTEFTWLGKSSGVRGPISVSLHLSGQVDKPAVPRTPPVKGATRNFFFWLPGVRVSLHNFRVEGEMRRVFQNCERE